MSKWSFRFVGADQKVRPGRTSRHDAQKIGVTASPHGLRRKEVLKPDEIAARQPAALRESRRECDKEDGWFPLGNFKMRRSPPVRNKALAAFGLTDDVRTMLRRDGKLDFADGL
jgi:hypothetical protein